MISKGEFLEHAEVFGNYYGTARHFLDQAKADGKDLLLDIDVQGAEQIKRKLPEAVSIFVMPPNRTELKRRLLKRGQDSDEVIERRLKAARREIENYDKYDYILVNDRLEDSIVSLEAILLSERLKRQGQPDAGLSERAESSRLDRVRGRVQEILRSFGEAANG
jgi:guanylate kinase